MADIFGFNSGRELVNALAGMTPRKEAVKGLTDQLMLERHGEMSNPEAIQRSAEAAIHNELRARVIATEWRTLGRLKGSVSALAKAATEAADATIAQRKVRDVKPHEYEAAEAAPQSWPISSPRRTTPPKPWLLSVRNFSTTGSRSLQPMPWPT